MKEHRKCNANTRSRDILLRVDIGIVLILYASL